MIYNASVFTTYLYDLFKENLKVLFLQFFDDFLTLYSFKMVGWMGKIN
jgi:hypothetical protein